MYFMKKTVEINCNFRKWK